MIRKITSLIALLVVATTSLVAQQTEVTIRGEAFYINGRPTYEGRYWKGNKVEGLLMNSRMVQGVFDDLNPETRDGFAYPDTGVWDANRNTAEFVENMETWRDHGVLGFTICLQGGSPVGYGGSKCINSAFDKNGAFRDDYKGRLKLILDRADELGMVPIVSYFYFGQDQYLENEAAVLRAVDEATAWILEQGYRNVIIEIANESDIYYDHEIIKAPNNHKLIARAKSITRDGRSLLVSTSLSGNNAPTEEIAATADFLLLHGNGISKYENMRKLIHKTRALKNYRPMPILVNEDDNCNFDRENNNCTAAVEEYVSWGFFDFRYKGETDIKEGYQTVPVDWGIDSERKQGFFNLVKEITAYGTDPEMFNNPILPGYHPDPSICRVGDEYYMVNSSFEWWPCMPIHRSRDLVNWELVGYGRVDPAKLPVREGTGDSGGIFAVTIRHHDGLFYLITTMIGGKGNFYITTADPTGEWSDPVWLGSEGIDPSLFWDEDGKCYYVGHGHPDNPFRGAGHCCSWVQELDTKAGKLVGKKVDISEGHAINASYAEGPHIYKKDGKYVLTVAEGGTGFTHSITQHYSDNIFGPYTPSHINPIITHRHLGADSHFQSIGHTDIVETQNGDWYMVALGTRNYGGHTYLARETFLTPMKWEYIYGQLSMVVNPGVGRVLEADKRPNLPWSPVPAVPIRDEFDGEELALKWNMLRSPLEKWYTLDKGELTLNLRPQTASEFVNPSLLAQRIQSINFTASTRMELKSKKDNEQAGIVLYRGTTSYATFAKRGDKIVVLVKMGDEIEEIASVDAPKGEVILTVKADNETLSFFYGEPDEPLTRIDATAPLRVISSGKGGQFNGPMVGVYATSNGEKSRAKATFKWFDYINR